MSILRQGEEEFTLQAQDGSWRLGRRCPDGTLALVGSGLFAGAAAEAAERQARVLLQALHPAGIRLVGPDLAHAMRAGDLRLVAPDVSHPNFVFWQTDRVAPSR